MTPEQQYRQRLLAEQLRERLRCLRVMGADPIVELGRHNVEEAFPGACDMAGWANENYLIVVYVFNDLQKRRLPRFFVAEAE